MRSRAPGSFWIPLVSTLLWASSGFAQQSAARLSGTVRDSSGAAVALAQLAVNGVRGASDSAGFFVLEGLRGGPATLRIRRVGFEPLDTTLQLAGGRSDSVGIVLTAVPRELAEVTTEANAQKLTHLSDFYRHRKNGSGYYLDRKAIEATRVQRLSDVLRRMPGVRLVSDRSGRYQVRMSRTSGGRDCPPDFWIDGIRAAYFNVDDVPLTDVDALEVYRGASSLPPEYLSRVGSPGCGVVVIWTRLPP
jgi:hypothetical protein